MFSPLALVLTAALATSGGPVPPQALPARSALDAPTAPAVHPLRFDLKRDAILTGSAGLLLLSSELFFKSALAPETCRWCDRNAQGEDTLPEIDRWGTGIAGGVQAQENARTWSNIVTVAVLPASVFGTGYLVAHNSGASGSQLGEDALMVGQAVLFSALTNQVVKLVVARERPFVHQMTPEERAEGENPEDNNLSFYSGHSNVAFALVASAATVARLRGYRHAEWVWIVGLPIATAVPLLRMAAGKHYLTDVAVGAVMGTAFGIAVPLLLHPRLDQAPPLSVSAGLGSVMLSGTF
jgi:membrane-associated phospholipid phosphatase